MQSKKSPIIIVLALILVLMAGTAFILLQDSNPADERGTLSGYVVNGSDSSYLKGVKVIAIDLDGQKYTSHENSDTTGDDGFFSLELPPNTYTILFEADGFQTFESSASYKVKKEKDTKIDEAFRLAAVETEPEVAEPQSVSQVGEPESLAGEAGDSVSGTNAGDTQSQDTVTVAQQTNIPVNYFVYCEDEYGNLLSRTTNGGAVGSTIVVYAPQIKDYIAQVPQKEITLSAEEDSNVVTFYYESTAISEESNLYSIPTDAVAYGGHHYFIFSDKKCTWEEAFSQCQAMGGYLAVINDASENEFLYQCVVDGGYEQAFFGLSLQGDDWEYIDGHSFDFEDWGYNSKEQKQPNNGDEGFTHVCLDTNMHDGHWSDSAFGKHTYTSTGKRYGDIYTFICEWDG